MGVLGYFIYQNTQLQKSNGSPISPSTTTPSSSPETMQVGKIYLVNKSGDINLILMDAPPNAEIKAQNQTGYITSTVKTGNDLYEVSAQSAGRGGPCPMEDFDSKKCGYTDDPISVVSPLKIQAVRVWSDAKGIFLINPWDIYITDKGINNIQISKLQPNTVFSLKEVEVWKQLLTTIKLQ